MKGVMRFGRRGKLSPRYIELFEILQTVGEVAYVLAFPPSFSAIHLVFYVFILRQYILDESHVLQWDSIQFDEGLTFVEEPTSILAREVRRLRSRDIPVVKFQWRHHPVEEATWEIERDMHAQYPYLSEFLGPFKELLVKLNHTSSSDVSPISCIIFGGSMSFTLTAAQDLGIPQVVFWAPSACGLLGIMHYHDLAKNGYFPFKDASDLTNGYLETTLDWILGMKGIYLRDLPSFMRSTNPDDFLFKYLIQETDRCKFASAIVINTFDLLEKEVLESLQALLPPIYMIDPLYFLVKHIEDKNLELLGSNLWKEDLKCLDNGINPQHGNKTQNIRQTEDQNGNKSRPTIIPQERDDTRQHQHSYNDTREHEPLKHQGLFGAWLATLGDGLGGLVIGSKVSGVKAQEFLRLSIRSNLSLIVTAYEPIFQDPHSP
ncbi:7-deoxyloganetin glucosyltransferase [Capsicum annuum]|nr:7-deoxyloganetin glucosyltransferase [Capsicum annuum]KAF3662843.1 7-deoxyloganetin glucosyltransferase [Capsicum annuum]